MFRLAPLTLAVALALVAPASAPASFPGANGKLVFEAPTRSTESLFDGESGRHGTSAPDASCPASRSSRSGRPTGARSCSS